jgi:hypothetical protein
MEAKHILAPDHSNIIKLFLQRAARSAQRKTLHPETFADCLVATSFPAAFIP